MEQLNVKQTAAKGGISGGVALTGAGAGAGVVLIAKHLFKVEIDLETGLLISGLITGAVSSLGRVIENAVKFYLRLKSMKA